MKLAVATLLACLLLGCSSAGVAPRAPGRLASASPLRFTRPAAPPRAKTVPPTRPAGIQSYAGSEPVARSAPPRCELGAAAAPGFYPSDEFPAGEVVLTFDDGPHPTLTPKVLEVLAQYGMSATFFIVGRNINAKTFPLVQRMVREGHTLASHSYNHDVGMAKRSSGERAIEYIRGQHEVTQILIDLALLASSSDDFEVNYANVFDVEAGRWLEAGSLRRDWQTFRARHEALLARRGFAPGDRPYRVLYSRPPAGTPYVGLSAPWQREMYAEAMRRLGLLNVMWHGESGDTHPEKKRDLAFLTSNLRHYARRGGVLLIHDYMRTDALRVALTAMARDPSLKVTSLDSVVARKFGCTPAALSSELGARARVDG